MDLRSPVQPVSKMFYLGIYLGCGILGGILMGIAAAMIAGGAAGADSGNIDSGTGAAIAGAGLLVLILGFASLMAGCVVLFVLYYKMWAAIQDGYARTTPGKAVGFMFIPVFQLYWIFQLIWGYSKDYNQFIRRHGIAAQPLPEGLFLSACIVPFLGIIPLVGWLATIANLIIFIMVVNAICNSINALAFAQSRAVQEVAVPLTNQSY